MMILNSISKLNSILNVNKLSSLRNVHTYWIQIMENQRSAQRNQTQLSRASDLGNGTILFAMRSTILNNGLSALHMCP